MEYLNKHRCFGFLLPDMYLAVSIKDFLEERIVISKPSRWSLKNNLSGIGFPGEILVFLKNIDLEHIADYQFKLTDPLSRFEIIVSANDSHQRFHPGSDPLSEICKNTGRYEDIFLLYQAYGNFTSLYGAIKIRSSYKEKGKVFEFQGQKLLLPLPA